ncbi:hypothetical protein ColTof4_14035 [Colletotrichum tofieldiae]|nr:hypothetical protein ColTof3_14670 [Colletotrichum tofieldiae]GKT81612.1 hypothetical protein ColTof4_14035 [Colletotrichum tofieldiae]GKT97586.1 hypothetical protein Ct61P_15436 [Colletotrichum tofieldiae]
MARDGYEACPNLVLGPGSVASCRVVLMPVKISEDHMVCGLIRQSKLAAMLLGYYETSEESGETTAQQRRPAIGIASHGGLC